MKFDEHLSFSNLSLSLSFQPLHFLDMWSIELCEHSNFALKFMDAYVTITSKVTRLLKNIWVVGICNRLCTISSGHLILSDIISFRIWLYNWVEHISISINRVGTTVAPSIPFAVSWFLIWAVGKLSLMIWFSSFTGSFKFDLRHCDVLLIIVYPSDIIQRRVSVMNRRDIDAERIGRYLIIWILFDNHVVKLPISRWWVTLAHVGFRMGSSLMMMMMVVLMPWFNLIEQSLKLLWDFLREIIGTGTSELKDLSLWRGMHLLLVGGFGLIRENSFWSSRLAIFEKLWLQLLFRSVRSNSNVAQILCNQIVNRFLENKIVTIVSNVFDSFIEFSEIGLDFLLVNSLFHAFWSNLKVLLFFLILQNLVCDVWIQHDSCGQLEIGMMQFTLWILINLVICWLRLFRIFFVDKHVDHVGGSLFVGVVGKESISNWAEFEFLFEFFVAPPV